MSSFKLGFEAALHGERREWCVERGSECVRGYDEYWLANDPPGMEAEPRPPPPLTPKQVQAWANLSFLPIADLSVVRDGEVMVDHWWIGDGKGGIAFVAAPPKRLLPQANRDKRIAEIIKDKLYPASELVHVHAVYLGRMKT